jgi:hypothetical protein
MTDQLGNPHKAALLTLMALAREVSNPELKELAGFSITGDVRTSLERDGYISSRKVGRAFTNKLTDKGWARCAEELAADRPLRPGPFGNALYVILGGLDRYLRRKNLGLAEVFQLGLEDQIRAAYQSLAASPREFVRLTEIRALLNGTDKSKVDGVIKQMSRDGIAHLAPDSNRKVLTDADHRAAIRVGGEDKHLLAIEES